SVLSYLFVEYSKKYGFDIEKYRKDWKYREKHQESVSVEAQAFLSWYDVEFTMLQNEKVGFLLNKRNDNIHQGYIVLVFRVEQPFKVKGSLREDLPVDWSKMYAYFPENRDVRAIDLCASFVDRLRILIDKAHEQFPL
ncbi:MAG: hypothetical protein ACR2IS_13170, partial [Nitrososphaeraceae archaeon]